MARNAEHEPVPGNHGELGVLDPGHPATPYAIEPLPAERFLTQPSHRSSEGVRQTVTARTDTAAAGGRAETSDIVKRLASPITTWMRLATGDAGPVRGLEGAGDATRRRC